MAVPNMFSEEEVTVVDAPVPMAELVDSFEEERTGVYYRPLLEVVSDGVPEYIEPERA